jgi:hypothetical protein
MNHHVKEEGWIRKKLWKNPYLPFIKRRIAVTRLHQSQLRQLPPVDWPINIPDLVNYRRLKKSLAKIGLRLRHLRFLRLLVNFQLHFRV